MLESRKLISPSPNGDPSECRHLGALSCGCESEPAPFHGSVPRARVVLAALVSLKSNVSQTDQAEGKHPGLAALARDSPVALRMAKTFLTEPKLPYDFRGIAGQPACTGHRRLGGNFFSPITL
jgi:hypothetical protein